MIKNYLAVFILMILSAVEIKSQTIYSDPTLLQMSSTDVKVYFDATGTPLSGLSPTAKVYAHTGYGVNWTGAPGWGTNSDKYRLTYVEGNLWMLYIGNIRTYYNVPSTTATVSTLNFVFRTEGMDKQTGDLFLKVYDEGLQINLVSDKGNIIDEYNFIKFTANASQISNITISVDGNPIVQGSGISTISQEYPFTAAGNYTVTATATSGGKTASETMEVICFATSPQVNYPGGIPKMGPVKNADGSVTFCLGAQDKKQVTIVGSWNNYEVNNNQLMNYQDTDKGRYFWTTIQGLDNDTKYLYYFIIDGGQYTVGDPYARLVLDPDNDKYLSTDVFPDLPAYPFDQVQNVPVAIYQGSINDYDWQVTDFKAPEATDLIIYELLFRDFTGTEGKALGNGTVRMAIDKIPYLKSLGVNAIEMLPICEFNGNISWGYNPNFYFAPDKAYGTPADYKEFIDICHQNGIAVILDMVFNQSDGLHPWYQMYNPGKNPYYNLNAPHAYSVLNDFNQGNPMLQEQWADVLRYWMTEYKFDGFRFDLVKGLGLNTSYANNGEEATNAYNATRVAEMRYLQSVMDEINPKAYFINENLALPKEENEMAETGQMNWANVNDPSCQFAMGYNSNANMNKLYAPQDSRTWGSTVSYLESHDEQRLAYKQNEWGASGIKGNVVTSMQRCGSAAAQMIMTPGAHMIWQFSEMGNSQNTKTDQGNNTDPKIVNWSLLNEPNHKGLYKSYCELIGIRMANPQLFTKEASVSVNLGGWGTGRYIYLSANSQELITFINPNITGSYTFKWDFSIKDNTAYRIFSNSYGSTPSFDAVAGTVTVPANCYLVIGSDSLISGVESVKNDTLTDHLRVRGGSGEIIVDYAGDGAIIYYIDGRLISKIEESGKLYVPGGLYIVVSGKYYTKVMVK